MQGGCQWRNGLLERQVAVLKRTLGSVLTSNEGLTFPEVQALFASSVNITNQRPLAVRNFSQDDFRSITPNDLLLGRNRLPLNPDSNWGHNDNIPLRIQTIKDLEKLWWDQWLQQV